MTTIYRIFSKVWFLNIVAVLMTLFTLQMTVVGIMNIATHGFSYFLQDNWIMLIFFVLYLLLDIWILTATFLPIIKINSDGISAYSIFWKRKIMWTEIQSAKLLKVESRHSTGRRSISFEFTKEPEKKNALTNKAVRVNTFIIISKKGVQKPKSLSLGGQLLNHNLITTTDDIAFEYEQTAWERMN